MPITTLYQTLVRTLLMLGFISLAACGGGGGEKKDTTPNDFTLAAIQNAAVSAQVESASITVTGINKPAAISITNGEYAIAGGTFTNVAGTVEKNQTVKVRLTTSANTNTPVSATLTIGGVSATFTVTTAPDVTPDAFSFNPSSVPDVEPNSEHITNTITVSDIDIPVAISITNGEYKIGDGAYSSTAGTVGNGQAVTVKVIAPSTTELTKEGVLTIGGVSASFSVTTYVDTAAPVAEFKFPTPYTMSEATSVKVRGTATDYNTITSVKVKVNDADAFDVTPKAEGDYSSWTADIPLTENSENTIVVLTEDEKGNSDDNAAQVVIRQAPLTSAFPDAVNHPFGSNLYTGMVLDQVDGENRLLVPIHDGIVAVDIGSGARSPFAATDTSVRLLIDPVNKYLYAKAADAGYLIRFLLSDPTVSQVFTRDPFEFDIRPGWIVYDNVDSQNTTIVEIEPNEEGLIAAFDINNEEFSMLYETSLNRELLYYPFGIALDKVRNRYLVITGGESEDVTKHAVVAIDRTTGASNVLSSNSVGAGELFSSLLPNENVALLTGIALHQADQRLFVVEARTGKLFEIDMFTGDRILFMDLTYSVDEEMRYGDVTLVLDEPKNIGFVSDDTQGNRISVVDLETGVKVILSQSN